MRKQFSFISRLCAVPALLLLISAVFASAVDRIPIHRTEDVLHTIEPLFPLVLLVLLSGAGLNRLMENSLVRIAQKDEVPTKNFPGGFKAAVILTWTFFAGITLGYCGAHSIVFVLLTTGGVVSVCIVCRITESRAAVGRMLGMCMTGLLVWGIATLGFIRGVYMISEGELGMGALFALCLLSAGQLLQATLSCRLLRKLENRRQFAAL